jgi:uncharacterized membrane protein YdjX (TVP38/TMEM64 family)
MPPMWAVLAAFHIGAGVPLLPLCLGSAATGAFGRYALARLSRRVSRFLPRTDRRNAEALGYWFNRRGSHKWWFVAGYSLGPLPSNALFIAAGAGRIPAGRVALIFGLCRAVSDTFWVWTGANFASNFGGLLRDSVLNWWSLALQLVGLFAVAVIFRLPWIRWLGVEEQAP